MTPDKKTTEADIEEKERRVKRIRDEMKDANYEERLGGITTKTHTLEAKRLELDKEITSLSLQADTRARLDLKRDALGTKTSEVQNMLVAVFLVLRSMCTDMVSRSLEVHNPRFRKLIGTDARAETMERDVERIAA